MGPAEGRRENRPRFVVPCPDHFIRTTYWLFGRKVERRVEVFAEFAQNYSKRENYRARVDLSQIVLESFPFVSRIIPVCVRDPRSGQESSQL